MYCKSCGNKLSADAMFCSNCGSPVAGGKEAPAAPKSAAPAGGFPFDEGGSPKKRLPVKWIAIGAAAVVILAVALLIPAIGGGGSTIDLSKLYTVSVQGVDGYGAVKLTENEEYALEWLCDRLGLDPEKVNLDVINNPFNAFGYYSFSEGMDVEGFTEDVFGRAMSERELEEMMEEMQSDLSVVATIDYAFSPDGNLSNGDEVEITFTYDEEAAKEAGLEIKNTHWTHTVEGLTDVATVDISPAMTMSAAGFDGYGVLTYSLDAAKLQSLGLTPEQAETVRYSVRVKCSQAEELKNGDTVMFTVEADTETLARNAVLIDPMRWEYTVTGLEAVEQIDAFEGLKLTCTGISPYLEVSLDVIGCPGIVQQTVDFTLPEGHARNGEPVTVTASISPERAQEYGVALAAETKDFTLEPQPEYISSIDGLDMSAILREMEDYLQAKSTSYNSIQRKASAFLHLKRQHEGEKHDPRSTWDRYTPYNAYCILYEAKNSSGSDRGLTVMIRNLCRQNDGSITWGADLYWDYANSYDEIFDERVTVQRDLYNVTIME